MANNQYWKKKEKKKDNRKVCSGCYGLFIDVDVFWIFIDGIIPHWGLRCEKCLEKEPEGTISKPYTKRKKKKVIDTKGWIEGEPTKKGNKRYIFITEDGKEVTLLAETGDKKGLTPKTKD